MPNPQDMTKIFSSRCSAHLVTVTLNKKQLQAVESLKSVVTEKPSTKIEDMFGDDDEDAYDMYLRKQKQ